MWAMSLRYKFSLMFGLIMMLAIGVFSVMVYQVGIDARMAGIDEELKTAAHATRYLIGTRFHDKLDQAPPNEAALSAMLTSYVETAGIKYV